MSSQQWRFNDNLQRVKDIVKLYPVVLASPRRPSVRETDILRAAIVFLHSAFEDYLRGIIVELLPLFGSENALNDIPLKTQNADRKQRPEKYQLGQLLKYKNQSVMAVIQDSVENHMSKESFNNTTFIIAYLERIGINTTNLDNHAEIDKMIQRRHRIVHQMDRNTKKGRGNHRASPITTAYVDEQIQAVASWVEEIDRLVEDKLIHIHND